MRERTRTLLLVVAAAFLAAGVPPAARAQGANATLSGTVKDETGGVVPGATVTIRNQETSLRRELVTDHGGRFTAPNLPPGPYEATVSVAGFSKLVRSGIRLTVGSETAVSLALAVGQREDKV